MSAPSSFAVASSNRPTSPSAILTRIASAFTPCRFRCAIMSSVKGARSSSSPAVTPTRSTTRAAGWRKVSASLIDRAASALPSHAATMVPFSASFSGEAGTMMTGRPEANRQRSTSAYCPISGSPSRGWPRIARSTWRAACAKSCGNSSLMPCISRASALTPSAAAEALKASSALALCDLHALQYFGHVGEADIGAIKRQQRGRREGDADQMRAMLLGQRHREGHARLGRLCPVDIDGNVVKSHRPLTRHDLARPASPITDS